MGCVLRSMEDCKFKTGEIIGGPPYTVDKGKTTRLYTLLGAFWELKLLQSTKHQALQTKMRLGICTLFFLVIVLYHCYLILYFI